jgi:hypothetical protein
MFGSFWIAGCDDFFWQWIISKWQNYVQWMSKRQGIQVQIEQHFRDTAKIMY